MWGIIVSVMITSSASMGFPVCLGVYGNEGLLRAIFSDVGDLIIFIILSIGLIIKFGGSVKGALKKAITFPVVWAIILAIIFNFYSIQIPKQQQQLSIT